ncbi:SCP2 domain-containing protein [Hydrogenophaga sp.]|uniref:ubiquinone biosynthesis accessory factor UbiJ n=1 Tax=Hydrogenophaga sp. TaxID=1904254 RepID=UPI00271E7FCB|nr:hypothetical protein [Hydrogenophaga sp.]MDO8903328.1 hypothetical protein [Hydrogenophaga sp.]
MKNSPPDSTSSSDATGGPGLLQSMLQGLRPPEWVVDELQNRVVLFLNHVLMQEKAAQDRLRRQKGKPVRVQWGDFHLTLAPTAAGLLERTSPDAKPELSMTLTQTSPLSLAQSVLTGQKPGVDIQGDVQLAAEVAWLVDNVRWDVEEDLSRFVGDATAHTLGKFARAAAQALQSFLARLPEGFAARSPFSPASSAPSAPPASAPAGPASGGEGGTAA